MIPPLLPSPRPPGSSIADGILSRLQMSGLLLGRLLASSFRGVARPGHRRLHHRSQPTAGRRCSPSFLGTRRRRHRRGKDPPGLGRSSALTR